MSQRHTSNTSQILQIIFCLNPHYSGKGHTSPGKNIVGKGFFPKHEMSISFQGSVATSQNNIFIIQ